MNSELKFQREMVELLVKYIQQEEMQMKTCIYLAYKVLRGLPLLIDIAGEDDE